MEGLGRNQKGIKFRHLATSAQTTTGVRGHIDHRQLRLTGRPGNKRHVSGRGHVRRRNRYRAVLRGDL